MCFALHFPWQLLNQVVTDGFTYGEGARGQIEDTLEGALLTFLNKNSQKHLPL